MKLKGILCEDFSHYKKPSMTLMFPNCSFKCEKECGMRVCHNSTLATSPNIEVNQLDIISRYKNNSIISALVCAGLEPFDSFEDLLSLISSFRKEIKDDIVIYTGYYKTEIQDKINIISEYPNIIIKFGRFMPNNKPHYDYILGVNLASDNQYGKVIS